MRKDRKDTLLRTKRTLTALLLMFVLSFSTVLAETEDQTAEQSSQSSVQTSTESGTDTGTAAGTETQTETQTVTGNYILKKGKNYYYVKANGKIRTKKGFVTVDGKMYYIKRGGKIVRGKTFKVKRKYYRANKKGVIKTGVYKWGKNRCYSNPKTGRWKKTAGFVTWNNRKYYVLKGGNIITDTPFAIDNVPYVADKKGRLTQMAIPDGGSSPVIKIAKEEVGVKTGIKYWVWYFKKKFIDTDRTPWCGAFVAWCYDQAGHYDKVSDVRNYGNLGYVPSYTAYANKHGKWIKKKKAVGGDIIIFGSSSHVGLVEGVVGDYIITIEGNAGPTSAYRSGLPGAVIRNIYSIDSKKIKGVIRVM